MRKWMALLCGLLLLAAVGCGTAESPPESPAYDLYFLIADLRETPGSGALRTETTYLEDLVEADTQQLAEALLTELLAGPQDETLKSAIPAGTSLLSLDVQGSRATVDFSAAYGSLSGVGLTLADYAVTLTLTQLPEISLVKIMVRGQELAYRDKQMLLARDVLLLPEEDVLGTVTAWLYFLNGEGALTAEERMLELYEGDTQVSAVAQALENGPESKELSPVWPDGFRVMSVWQEEGVCYVNLSSAILEETELPEKELSAAIEALGHSLCSLETVEETRFLVDGEFVRDYGSIDISEPYTG